MDKILFGYKIRNILYVFLFYMFFALLYYFTLSYSQSDFIKNKPVYGLERLLFSFIDYTLKFLLTIPGYFFIFKYFKHKTLKYRLRIHLISLPLFIFTWQRIFYLILETFYSLQLKGSATIWDIYIPGMFYCIQFGILHALEYYNDNLEQQKIQSELRELALKSELSSLKSQLNPHFLYNVFNTINASVPKEQEKTRVMIATLADMFRYQLKASQSDCVTIRDEINFVEQYLQLEKARFEERLQVEFDIPDDILQYQITPMIIQPLVENAVKHGISDLIDGGSILIKINKIDNKLRFMIADTGVGIENKTDVIGKGIGLTNIKLILEKTYCATLKLSDNEPQGLKVEFEIDAQ